MLISMPILRVDDVPEDFLEILKARAERQGISLSAYVVSLLARAIESPEEVQELSEEWIERARSREPTGVTVAEIVALIREGRGEWPQ
jgi:hypothetical protein